LTASLVDAVLLQIELDYTDDNGNSKRSHLENAWNQTGIKPTDLKEAEIPEAGLDLYQCFWELYKQDGVSWSDFYYYGLYTDIWFTGEERKILHKMESTVNSFLKKKMKPKK